MSHDNPALKMEVLYDVPFGRGVVGYGTSHVSTRALTMDVYAPTSQRPSILFAHGGAFHRGSKGEHVFEESGHRDTSMAEYCRRFTERGFVCFSVGYRLTQERPAPHAVGIKLERKLTPRGRIDHVRALLGLPLASDLELLHGVEGAISDLEAAFWFVRNNAARWQVDIQRMAVAGFSAGATSWAYAAYARGIPARAVISLSGAMDTADAAHYLTSTPGSPPLLVVTGEADLPTISNFSRALSERALHVGIPTIHYVVPGGTHFYPRDSAVRLVQSNVAHAAEESTVEEAMHMFLESFMPPD